VLYIKRRGCLLEVLQYIYLQLLIRLSSVQYIEVCADYSV